MKPAKQSALEALDIDDRETLVRCFQKEHGLAEDGWPGAVTMEMLGIAQGDGHREEEPDGTWKFEDMAEARIVKARKATSMEIKYKLGSGGLHAVEGSPASPRRQCDCSGFASWVMGKSRKHKFGRYRWISTDSMLSDSRTHKDLFRPLDGPLPGCFVVYGSQGNTPGHVALVTGLDPLTGIDCSSSVSKRTGSAISERNIEFFLKRDHQFMVPKE